MHQESKNPDAHRRLARGSGASFSFRALTNRRYMAKAEFAARQLWLDFEDAVGPALQAIAEVVMNSRKQLKAWLRSFVRTVDGQADSMVQLVLEFEFVKLTKRRKT